MTTRTQTQRRRSVFGALLAIRPDIPLQREDALGLFLQLLAMDVERLVKTKHVETDSEGYCATISRNEMEVNTKR